MPRETTSKRSRRKASELLEARYERARSKMFLARSKSEFERWERDVREAAEGGIAEAWHSLFDAWRRRKSRLRARQCAEKMFEHGDEDDVIGLALDCIYEDWCGTLLQQRRPGFDPRLGLAGLERRARMGEVPSMYWLSQAHAFGGPIPRNDRRAVLWLRRAANAGDIDSMTNLGVRHIEGRGVRRSGSLAMVWYRKAARRSCATAISNIGLCYLQGRGVRKNGDEALRYFRKAARLGSASAAVRIADAILDGRIVGGNPRRALHDLRRRAARGQPHAMESLAKRLIEGRGVKKDVRRGRNMLARLRRKERKWEQDFSHC
jgi:TPR repeat protein